MIFCKIYDLVSQYYAWNMLTLFFECFDILNIYFLFSNIYSPHGLCFATIAPISKIEIIEKGAYLNLAMDAILPRYAPAGNKIAGFLM